MKIKELFENTIQLPPEVQDIIDNNEGELDKNGRLNLFGETGNVTIQSRDPLIKNGEIIYPLGIIQGDFDCGSIGLRSFKNFPLDVASSLYVMSNRLTSLEGITPIIGGMLDISGNEHLISLAGIGKQIKECDSIFLPPNIKQNILGLLKIKNLQSVNFDDSDEEPLPELLSAVRIINKHLQANNRDILACQEELMEAGLNEYAKL